VTKSSAGNVIKLLREKLGYSQEVVAQFLSVKREMVSYYETGARDIPFDALEKLADLFGVELDVFLSEHPEDALAEVAFAFRAEQLNEKDLAGIAKFRKIVRNYHRLLKLEQKNA
jgi:transcriptional regulator with XRE-family HTH domain